MREESGSGTSVKRQAQIPNQLDLCHEAANTLHDDISNLEMRLEGVMRPITPSPPSEKLDKAEEGLVPVADSLKQLWGRMTEASDRLRSVARRMEL